MPAEFVSAIAFLSGALVAMIASCKIGFAWLCNCSRKFSSAACLRRARSYGLWRPPVFGAFTRIYFEFEPSGSQDAVRTCHVDRRSSGELAASLPAVGSSVGIRYLPENPTQAVIAKLVSRFVPLTAPPTEPTSVALHFVVDRYYS